MTIGWVVWEHVGETLNSVLGIRPRAQEMGLIIHSVYPKYSQPLKPMGRGKRREERPAPHDLTVASQ